MDHNFDQIFFLLLAGLSTCESSGHSVSEGVLKLSRYLKAWYKKFSVIPDDFRKQWPPTLGQYYYDLMLLERARNFPTTSNVSSYLASLSTGKLTHAAKDMIRMINLKSMFISSENTSESATSLSEFKIVVTGVPGIGKTTLARKISHEWATGSLLLNFSLVLLFPLREERVYRAKDIRDLVGYHSPNLAADVAHIVEETCGLGVLFIFDGWDELPTGLQGSQSIFLDMIQNKVLPNCSVLVTVRSYAAGDLLKLPSVTKHVEIAGFSQKEITQCVRSNIPNPENAENLLWQLKLQKHIMSACYVPLNFAIVLYVAKIRNYDLPNTLSKLYQIFVQNALLRHMKRLPEYQHIKALRYMEDMPAAVQTDFDSLCRLALDGLTNEKVTFFDRDISHYFPNLKPQQFPEPDNPFLGLLTSMRSFSEFGEEEQYQFLHVTTQEFLAAWRIAFHDEFTAEAQVAFLKQYRDNPRFYRTFVFVSGLTHLQGASFLPVLYAPVQFSDLVTNTKLSGKRTVSEYILFIAEMLYEAQDPSQTAVLASNIQDASLCITIDPSSALRSLITICHFLMSSEKTWNVVQFSYFDPVSTGESPFQFLDKDTFIETSTQVEELKLENFLSLQDIRFLMNIPPFTATKKLTLIRFHNASDTEFIRTVLAERGWVKFGLSLWDTANFNLQAVLEMLMHNKSIGSFHLNTIQEIEHSFDPSSQAALCKLVSLNHVLHTLRLNLCGISSRAAQQLSHCLSGATGLKHLDLSDNPLGREGQTAIFQSLVANSTVTHLILRRTRNDDEDDNPAQVAKLYKATMQMFTLNKTLLVLDISLNHHFDANIGKWIASGLRVNTTLQELKLEHLEIPAAGILAIFFSLEGNSSLRTLVLSGRRVPHWLHAGEDAAKLCKSKMSSFLGSLLNLMEALNGKKCLQDCDTALCKNIERNMAEMLETISQLNNSIDDLAKFVNAATEQTRLLLVSKAVQNALQKNKLEVLDIRSCHVHPSAIAAGLSKNRSLIELQVGGYPISSDGLIKILESVSQNTTLKKLMLESIEVDDRAMDALIRMLLCNKSLTSLGVCRETDVSETCARRLLKSLHGNATLEELVLPEKFTRFVVPELIQINQKRREENHPPIQFRCAPSAIDVYSSLPMRYIALKALQHGLKHKGKNPEPFRWTRRKHL